MPQHTEVRGGLLNRKELRAQDEPPEPPVPGMDMGSLIDPSFCSSVTLIYTLSCHFGQEKRKDRKSKK